MWCICAGDGVHDCPQLSDPELLAQQLARLQGARPRSSAGHQQHGVWRWCGVHGGGNVGVLGVKVALLLQLALSVSF